MKGVEDMSHFRLKDQPVRGKRKGVWLRFKLNPDVVSAIRRSRLMRGLDLVEWVELKELRPGGKVMLEVWCVSALDSMRNKCRHNVFHVVVDENEEWICEGDLGRGLA